MAPDSTFQEFRIQAFLNSYEQFKFKTALKTPKYVRCEQICSYLAYFGIVVMLFLNLFYFALSRILRIILKNHL